VSTGALISLGQPRTVSSVPSLGAWPADTSRQGLGAEEIVARDPVALRTATWTQRSCWNGFRRSAFIWGEHAL
jgi:hypothetical protein